MFTKVFKTIVVGVDFSDYSKLVVRQAQLLSQIWKTKLVLVHAIHDPVVYSPSLYMSFPNVMTEKSYEERIKKIYDLQGSKIKIRAQRGTPTDLILSVARQFSDPLVVVGHRGHHKIAKFFFGSTSQNLALKAKIPVWIHRGSKLVKPHRILIPHDLSTQANLSIDIIKKLALAYPMSYEVFYVQEKALPVLDYETYKDAQQKILKKTQIQAQNLFKKYPHLPFVTADGEISNKILKKTKNFDLLVMAQHNPKGWLSKSETADLLNLVEKPILVVH